ncbi:MAG: hypothetical protein JW795_22795 [Chitinivibrionales bacterium]|nr:hypothetical protein [Chitinivibrionales bacterium]
MRSIRLSFARVFFLLFSGIYLLHADQHCDEQLRFADHSFAKKEYDNALTEYQRYVCMPNASKPLGLYRIALTYQANGQLLQAARAFEEVLDCQEESGSVRLSSMSPPSMIEPVKLSAHIDLFKNCVLRQEYSLARYELSQLRDYPQGSQNIELFQYFEILLHLHQYQMDSAQQKMQSIQLDTPYSQSILRLAEAIQNYRSQDFKRPSTAMMLSAVVPGLGQWYAGQKAQGVRMFALVSALSVVLGWRGYTAITTSDTRIRAVAIMDCTVWGLAVWRRYYTSGRNKAYMAAAHHNRDIQVRFQNQLKAIENF